MDRQVGRKKRRTRAQARAPLAQLSKPAPEGATEEASGQSTPPARIPHDPALERDLVAALAAATHVGPKPAVGDFYDVTLARIARAFLERRADIGRVAGAWIERNGDPCATYLYAYEHLDAVLADLGDPRPRVNAFFAGILAGAAFATDGRHTRRLADLARARTRLAELETERAALEELVTDTRPL